MRKLTTEEFIRKSKETHGDKYDYSKVEYGGSMKKVCIICNRHGEFWQSPCKHLGGMGCPKCGKERSNLSKASNTNEFIRKSKETHGDKYDYSKVEYVNNKTKVCIICHEHGGFWQIPSAHLYGQGCPRCGKEREVSIKASNTNEFIEKAMGVHGDRYDYSKVEYKNSHTKVCITCLKHGGFWQIPSNHLHGHGCPVCRDESLESLYASNTDEFIEKARQVHGNKYDYSMAEYVNSKEKICIICPKHGEFWQEAESHLRGCGCPKCANKISRAEEEIMELVQGLNPQQRNREILGGKEIDIYIPSIKLGIEYNGLRWHSEEFGRDRHYHIDKLNECNDKGVRLIQIFEDEWINHREICESKLRQICGLNANPKVYARKCLVKEIKNMEAKEFLNKNHIQGYAPSTVYLGCFYNKQLVGAMSFKREHEGYWDLNRFATDIHYQCIGVGGKLFKYFTKSYPFTEIKSFADHRWTTDPQDNLYTKLGFELVGFTNPDYRYYDGKTIERIHKFNCRKHILNKKYGLPLTMTESQMVKEIGYVRIWDCGLIKYIYREDGVKQGVMG